MNALEAKATQELFKTLVAGDPLGRESAPPCPLDLVLKGAKSANVDELAAALGGVDRNRVEHHLLARGYAPSESDANVFERRPWHTYPWPCAEESCALVEE